ncbi:MAG TPA: VTT domain-containing protein [Terrimesophilobacter sp.]|nr:VTT domain-containing protein [Terrimesophilobacter sp.]
MAEGWWLDLVGGGWLYPTLFLLTVADAFLVVLPSEIAVAALASLWVTTGSPPILSVAAVVAAGAVVGDSACYAIGRWIGMDRWAWQRRPLVTRAIARAEAGIGHRAALLVFTARYVPYARIAVNLTFGSTRFPYRRFLPLSAAAGCAWALYHSLTGAFFGSWFHEHPVLAVIAAILGATGLGLAIDAVASARARHRGSR